MPPRGRGIKLMWDRHMCKLGAKSCLKCCLVCTELKRLKLGGTAGAGAARGKENTGNVAWRKSLLCRGRVGACKINSTICASSEQPSRPFCWTARGTAVTSSKPTVSEYLGAPGRMWWRWAYIWCFPEFARILCSIGSTLPSITIFQLRGGSHFLFWTFLEFGAEASQLCCLGGAKSQVLFELNQKVLAGEPGDRASRQAWASEGALVCEWVDVWARIRQFFLRFELFLTTEVVPEVKKRLKFPAEIESWDRPSVGDPLWAIVISNRWENVINCLVNASRQNPGFMFLST